MTVICQRCWASCDVDDNEDWAYDDDGMWDPIESRSSICCHADTIVIDEEELEDIADDITNNCFTFDQAFQKHGNIAYYIAENLVFLPGYDEV